MSAIDESKFMQLPLDGAAKRFPSAVHCLVWCESAWGAGTVQVQVATPRAYQAGIWMSPSELAFTEAGTAVIPGDLYMRAVNVGAPADVVVELFAAQEA